LENLPRSTAYKLAVPGAGDTKLVGKEIGALTKVMVSPLVDLSEESLLGIQWKELASEVNTVAPTT
jgi:hypothetical protein